jgi:hypothetical protein
MISLADLVGSDLWNKSKTILRASIQIKGMISLSSLKLMKAFELNVAVFLMHF